MPIYTDFNEWLRNFKGVIPEPLKPIIHPNNVFITPIAKSYKPKNGPCSRRDWEEQIERKRYGLQMMWDGPAVNRPQPSVNDLMVVWFHNHHVEVYTITKVLKSSQRLPSWSINIGQSDRCVIYLDKDPVIIDWNTWIFMGGFKRCMGTTNVSSCKYNVIDYWLSKQKHKY
jgi:hypothetical protein